MNIKFRCHIPYMNWTGDGKIVYHYAVYPITCEPKGPINNLNEEFPLHLTVRDTIGKVMFDDVVVATCEAIGPRYDHDDKTIYHTFRVQDTSEIQKAILNDSQDLEVALIEDLAEAFPDQEQFRVFESSATQTIRTQGRQYAVVLSRTQDGNIAWKITSYKGTTAILSGIYTGSEEVGKEIANGLHQYIIKLNARKPLNGITLIASLLHEQQIQFTQKKDIIYIKSHPRMRIEIEADQIHIHLDGLGFHVINGRLASPHDDCIGQLMKVVHHVTLNIRNLLAETSTKRG